MLEELLKDVNPRDGAKMANAIIKMVTEVGYKDNPKALLKSCKEFVWDHVMNNFTGAERQGFEKLFKGLNKKKGTELQALIPFFKVWRETFTDEEWNKLLTEDTGDDDEDEDEDEDEDDGPDCEDCAYCEVPCHLPPCNSCEDGTNFISKVSDGD